MMSDESDSMEIFLVEVKLDKLGLGLGFGVGRHMGKINEIWVIGVPHARAVVAQN
jgi:hypothetical protein